MTRQGLLFSFSFLSYLAILAYFVFGGILPQLFYFISILPLIYFLKNKINVFLLFSLLILIFLFICFSFFSPVYEVQYSLVVLLYLIGSIIVAFAFGEIKNKVFFSKLILYSFFVFLFFKFVKLGFFNPDQYNLNIFNDLSRNIVSAFLIFLIVFFAANHYLEDVEHPLIPYILTFLCCVVLYGRSAILISFFMLLFVFFLKYKKNYYFLSFLLIIILSFFFFYYQLISAFILESTNFKDGLDSPRSTMIDEYLFDINYKDIVFGRNFQECCYSIVAYGSNPHNSFINGHVRFGILHTLVMVFLFLLCFIYSILNKKIVLLVLVLVLFSRYFVDSFGLFSPIDVFFIYLVIFIVRKKVV